MVNTVTWYTLEPGFAANFHVTEAGNYFGVNESSRDISNKVDLAHLIKLRSQADAVVVGGATARRESYKPSSRFATYVFTSQPLDAALNQLEFSTDAELSAQISKLKTIHSRVLSECGPALLNKFLQGREIDQLFLTVSFTTEPTRSEAERIARSVLRLENYQLTKFEIVENCALTAWRRA